MNTTESSVCPASSDPWSAIDVNHWHEVPCLIGSVATEDDVCAGRATFYLQSPDEIGACFEDIGLPHCAICTDDHQQIPVIIIQSERAGDKHYIGFRYLDGGNGVGLRFEFQLLDEPNEIFHSLRA